MNMITVQNSPLGTTEIVRAIDPRLKLMSYSSLLTLHSCPRKYELYRKKATEDEQNPEAATNQNITFAYGHIVGDGIQKVMEGLSEDEVLWHMYLGWHADLEDVDTKRKKSYYLAVIAIQRFIALREAGYLEDYELMWWKGKPATELSFSITFPDDFVLRGSVDAVLKHKVTGEVMVLECKTSSASAENPTKFKNSAQGVGYSVVLDVIAPGISSYKVLYLVYLTGQMAFEPYEFPKTFLQRATWIQELLLDIESIKMYDSVGVFPMRGESCYSFYRECEYLNQCTLSNAYVTVPWKEGMIVDDKVYDVKLTLMDLLNAQLGRSESLSASTESMPVGIVGNNLNAEIL